MMDERRKAVRLAGGSRIDAAVMDQNHQPVTVLHDLEVVNISAGGMAMATTTPVASGSRVQISSVNAGVNPAAAGMFPDFEVQVINCIQGTDNKHVVRCKLAKGSVPATLIYHW